MQRGFVLQAEARRPVGPRVADGVLTGLPTFDAEVGVSDTGGSRCWPGGARRPAVRAGGELRHLHLCVVRARRAHRVTVRLIHDVAHDEVRELASKPRPARRR